MAAFDKFDKKGQEQPYRSVSGLRPRGAVEGEREQPVEEVPAGHAATASLVTPEPGRDRPDVARLLDEAAQWMARVAQGPLRQELQQTLERYQRTVRQWDDVPPSEAQRAILLQGAQILRSAIARATLTRST